MKRLGAAVLALAATLPGSARAAEITRVASSFEDKQPFGMFLDLGFERIQQRGKLVREFHQPGVNPGDPSELVDVSELRYVGVDSRLTLDLHVGIWQDLELHYGLPIVFAQDRLWRFAQGTDASNSTIYNNCLQANGQLLDPNCPSTGAGRRPLFDVNEGTNSYRGGLGDMTFGLAYAVFNQRKDDTKPTWVIGVDYTAPTAGTLDPTVLTSPTARGNLGDRHHKYKFFTSFSRRMGVADPYFQVHYTLPFRGPGWYSNCDHPNNPSMGRPENCSVEPWTRSETGIRLPHRAGIIFGSEFNAFEEPAKAQKVAIDLRTFATYVSEGRYYNEMSDLFGKLLQTQDFVEMGGSFGLVAHAAEYVHLRASASLAYQTEHLITNEAIGRDFTGEPGVVDVTAAPIELNPNFDWRVDMVSRRFRLVEATVFRVDVSASFIF